MKLIIKYLMPPQAPEVYRYLEPVRVFPSKPYGNASNKNDRKIRVPGYIATVDKSFNPHG